ncbi:MAG: hypothetical protein ACLGHE_05190 [Gammaproteobacteria bacterium]
MKMPGLHRLLLLPSVLLLSGFSLESEQQKLPGLTIESQGAFILVDTKKPEKLPLLHRASTSGRNDGEVVQSGIARSDQDDPKDYDWILKPDARELELSAPGRFFLVRPTGSRSVELWSIDDGFKKAIKVRDTDYTLMQAAPVRGLLVAGRPTADGRGFHMDILSSLDGQVLTTFANVMAAPDGKLVGQFGQDYLTLRLADGKTGLVAVHQAGDGARRYSIDAETLAFSWDSLHEVDGLRFGLRTVNGAKHLDIFQGAAPLVLDDGVLTRLVRLHATSKGMTHERASGATQLPFTPLPDASGQALGWAVEVLREDGDRVWHLLDVVNGKPQLDPVPWKDISLESQGYYGSSRREQFLVVQRLDGAWVPMQVEGPGKRGQPQHAYAAPEHNKLMAMTNRRNDINSQLARQYRHINEGRARYDSAMSRGDAAAAKLEAMQLGSRAYVEAILKFGAGNETEKATAKVWARSVGGNLYAQTIDKLGTSDYLEARRAAQAATDAALKKRLQARADTLKDSYLRALNPHLYSPAVTSTGQPSSNYNSTRSSSSYYDTRSNRGIYNSRYGGTEANWRSYQNSVQRHYDNKAFWDNHNRRR